MCQSASSWAARPRAAPDGSGRARRPRSRRADRGSGAPSDVREPDALAGDERDVVARVGREQRGEVERRAHASTAVAPIVASTPCRAAPTAARSFGTIPPASSPASSSRSASPTSDRGGDRAAEQQPGNVGDEEEPLGAEPDRQRGGRLVRVDVQRADRRAARRPGSARRREPPRSPAGAREAASRRARARAPAPRRVRSRRRRGAPRADRSPRRFRR